MPTRPRNLVVERGLKFTPTCYPELPTIRQLNLISFFVVNRTRAVIVYKQWADSGPLLAYVYGYVEYPKKLCQLLIGESIRESHKNIECTIATYFR